MYAWLVYSECTIPLLTIYPNPQQENMIRYILYVRTSNGSCCFENYSDDRIQQCKLAAQRQATFFWIFAKQSMSSWQDHMLTPVMTKQSSSEALKKRAGKNRNKWQEDNEYFPFLLIILFNKIIQSARTFVLDLLIISLCEISRNLPLLFRTGKNKEKRLPVAATLIARWRRRRWQLTSSAIDSASGAIDERGATAKSQPSKKIRQCRSSVSLETGAFCPCKPDGRHAIRNRAETHGVCPAFCPIAKCGGQAPKLYKLRARLPFLQEPSSLSSEKKKGRIV